LANSSPGQIAENSIHVTYAAQSYQQAISPPVQSTVTQQYQPIPPATTPFLSLQPNPILYVHPTSFFYRPLNDFCHYYVNCESISYDNVTHLLNQLKKQNIQSNENECVF